VIRDFLNGYSSLVTVSSMLLGELEDWIILLLWW